MEPAILMAASSWFWWLILPFLAWVLFSQVRHMVGEYRSVRWPVTDAAIQRGAVGFVPVGRGQGTPAFFVGYVFGVNDSAYTGLVALYGSRDDVEKVNKSFLGGSICVRYNPANPSLSYLSDLNDVRFGRLTPTHNPQHLAQAPSFDLQDVVRR